MSNFDEADRLQAFCDHVCTVALAHALGVSCQWDMPFSQMRVRKDLRLAVVHRHIHYYKRNVYGPEYEVPPEGFLPEVPEEHVNLPATEEQLQATEHILGFPFPPLLRALYKQVANGGIGPCQGLFGALGGGDKDEALLTDEYLFQKANHQTIDLLMCKLFPLAEEKNDSLYLTSWEIKVPQGYWPDRLLPLINAGCNTSFFLDIPTDRVFYSGTHPLRLRLVASSSEGFFERWMRNKIL